MNLRLKIVLLLAFVLALIGSPLPGADEPAKLDWQALPDLPNNLGVAGPFVGVHNDVLILAGGANFAHPVWDHDKQWHDQIYVLQNSLSGYEWTDGGKLPRPIAYGATVSTQDGVVCMGGNDAGETFDAVFALRWDSNSQKVQTIEYPSLPRPCAYGQATLIGNVIYLAGGQSGNDLESAMNNFWSLDLSQKSNPDEFQWQELAAWSDEPRAFNITAAQHNGYEECVYVISGRRAGNDGIDFLRDVWQYTPRTDVWRRRQDVPRSVCGDGHRVWAKSSVRAWWRRWFVVRQDRRTERRSSRFSQGSIRLSHDHRYLGVARFHPIESSHHDAGSLGRSNRDCQR